MSVSMNFVRCSTLDIDLNISLFYFLDGDVQESISKAEQTQLTCGRTGKLN